MTILRNIFAVLLGLVAGSVINMLLITVGAQIIPPPPGVDVTDMDSIRSSMHLYGPEQFIVPFLAHAIGTLAGAWVAFRLAIGKKTVYALVVGTFFFAGGIAAAVMLPAPVWFIVLDLVGAYFPMAWIAVLLGRRSR